MEKKGISPLIATVLLIGFTIVLAAVVMRWGGEFVRETTEETACETEIASACINLRFDIENVANNLDQQGAPTNSVDIYLSSRSDQPIDGFRFILWNGSEVGNTREELTVPLEPFTTNTYNVGFGTNGIITQFSDITEVEVIPIVNVEGCEQGTCSESGIKYEL